MVKLSDKCLKNAMESPVAAATWLPADMKSNILKAQAEAGHKVIAQLRGVVTFLECFYFPSVACCWRRCLAGTGSPRAKVQSRIKEPFSLPS